MAAKKETLCEKGITIGYKEIIHAFNIIGIDKAPSFDGMTDIIFKRKSYEEVRVMGVCPLKTDMELLK